MVSRLLMISLVLQLETSPGFSIGLFAPAYHLGIIPAPANRSLLSDWACSPSVALTKMCQIRLRGKTSGLILIWAIIEFHANKLSWLTVTVQWLGSTSVTWPPRASSLSEPIMRKWTLAIELCNDKYWLISALIGCFNYVMGVWAYRIASNCSVVMCIMIYSSDFFSTSHFMWAHIRHTPTLI